MEHIDFVRALQRDDHVRWRSIKGGRTESIKEGIFDMFVPNSNEEYCFVKVLVLRSQAFKGAQDGPRWHRVKIQTKNILTDDAAEV